MIEKKTIDSSVISDIYYRTEGHAGSISFFGKLIDESNNICDKREITHKIWQNFIASKALGTRLIEWLPISKMKDTLLYPYTFDLDQKQESSDISRFIPLITFANNCFYNYILTSNAPVSPPDERTHLAFQFLASEGAVVHCGGDQFKVFFNFFIVLVRVLTLCGR